MAGYVKSVSGYQDGPRLTQINPLHSDLDGDLCSDRRVGKTVDTRKILERKWLQ